MAVSRRFRYGSLYREAKKASLLDAKSLDLFKGYRTNNFEVVLAALSHSVKVSRLLGLPYRETASAYRNVRASLVKAVEKVHVPHASVGEAIRRELFSAVKPYCTLFSTNYDLLLYWAIQTRPGTFDDRFRTSRHGLLFSPGSRQAADAQNVYFLHGGIHLYRDSAGRTIKDQHDGTRDILTRFRQQVERPDSVPLFVTEGTAADKLRVIRRSDYLSHALTQLEQHQGPLVVFGLSLGESDSHLVEAMQGWDKTSIAISVLPTDPNIASTKARYHNLLSRHRLTFYDASTHPLGSPKLHVP
jgi:hypothetical protein